MKEVQKKAGIEGTKKLNFNFSQTFFRCCMQVPVLYRIMEDKPISNSRVEVNKQQNQLQEI